MTNTSRLHRGDPFPALTLALPGGRTLRLPDALAGHSGVILFYRGSRCPYRQRPAERVTAVPPPPRPRGSVRGCNDNSVGKCLKH
jgi:hypothetical protein